jgi:tetratricopeptide (TPR) repeat protein
MSRRCLLVWLGGLVLAGTALGVVGVWAAQPGPASAEPQQMVLYAHPDGTKYFGLCLRAPTEAKAASGVAVAILFDTSAGQVGDFRAKALEVLDALLKTLGPEDRVQLFGVDVNTIPLSEGFLPAQSPQMQQAVEKLQQRTPLGATDLPKALTTALEQLRTHEGKPRTILYVGKGTSKVRLLDPESFADLVKSLTQSRVSVHSYAIGPGPDLALLGALAAQTGGTLLEDSPAEASAIARQLSAGLHGPVFWPVAQKAVWPAALREIYPAQLPPLRTDRETVLVGCLEGDGPLSIQASLEGPAGQVDLAWTVPVPAANEDHNYLPALVELGRKDPTKGTTLPLVDAASLKRAKALADTGARNLTMLARQALAADQPAEAERLAQAALKQDPRDPEAQAILRAARGQPAGGNPAPAAAGAAKPATGEPALDLQGPGAAPPAVVPGAGALVEQYQQRQNLLAQMVSSDVTQTINRARSIMAETPDAAINELKLQMENVRRVPELDEAVRTRLLGQLEAAIREAQRRQQIKEERDRERDINLAKARERTLLQESLLRREEKIRQIMDRFSALMDERKYAQAEEGAMTLRQEAPGIAIGTQALTHVQMSSALVQMWQLRAERERQFYATLAQVEHSHIPFPDEPPIAYPDADTWQQLTARRKERYQAMDLASVKPAEKRILQQLDSPTSLEFPAGTTVKDVLDFLKEYHKIEIQLDTQALKDVGITSDKQFEEPISLKGISLRSALRLLLRQLQATYLIENEVLLITTPDKAQERLTTKVYPVADLVIPIQTPAFQGGFGGLGGWGMGINSGFGGMGNTWGGGMGGWGRGMGNWNIPPERLPLPVRDRLNQLLPQKNQQGFRAFSVPDSPGQTHSSPQNLSSQAHKSNPGSQADQLRQQLLAITTPEGYQAFFAAHQDPPVSPAVVRQVVRELMEANKFSQVAALIEAALRNHQPQPWMYEALGLALQADGRPLEEIERVVLSALDFAQSPLEMTYIGLYLARLGLDQRAIQIYRQAAQLDPRRPEPYMAAIRSAEKLGDLEAKQWASLGILRQAWPKEQIEVWNTAHRVARSVLEELRAAGKTQQAQEFEKAMQTALVRDVVIRVQWTGNADVDLLVEEPSGSVCSARNPRSTGGGILLGDGASRQLDSVREGPAEEIYVCPEGFSGTYRALIRRVWGELTAGKVQVEVICHFRTNKQRRIFETIDLKNDETLVVFDLMDGRRKQSLQEEQTHNAVVDQLTLRQQILAQQIAAAVDPRALAPLVASRTGSTGGDNPSGGTSNGHLFPWFPRGAVGYQPVIITLPEGTNLAATGVVSADRRYVRVTCIPLFSRITDVRIYNTSSGEESQGRLPGTGGSGY